MSLLAKIIVKNKCWVVEDNGRKIGTILSHPKGVVFVDKSDQHREQYASLKILSDKYNIVVDKTPPRRIITENNTVYGYPCEYRAHNILWDVKHKLPIFTKGNKSKSFFCAGYYIIKFNNGWVKSYCPKLITLNRYPFQGPYHTQEEMREQLKFANGDLNGSADHSTKEL